MKRRIANWCLKYLFNAVTHEDVLRQVNGHTVFRGQVVNQATQKDLVSGAKTLKQLNTFKMLMQEMKYLSNKRMFEHSKTNDDILFGKAMLYAVDILESKVDNISKL